MTPIYVYNKSSIVMTEENKAGSRTIEIGDTAGIQTHHRQRKALGLQCMDAAPCFSIGQYITELRVESTC
jgi:hypothetical protein